MVDDERTDGPRTHAKDALLLISSSYEPYGSGEQIITVSPFWTKASVNAILF